MWVVSVPDESAARSTRTWRSWSKASATCFPTPYGTHPSARALRSRPTVTVTALAIKISSAKPRLESDEYDKLFDLFFTGDVAGPLPGGNRTGAPRNPAACGAARRAASTLVPPQDENDAIGFEMRLPFAAGLIPKRAIDGVVTGSVPPRRPRANPALLQQPGFALRTSSTRLRTLSLAIRFARWLSTVRTLIWSSSAI